MPLEGQWQRRQQPLGRRERRVLSAIALALALSLVVVIALSVLRGGGIAKAGCISVTVPSTTGGANAQACGPDAARTLREIVAPPRGRNR